MSAFPWMPFYAAVSGSLASYADRRAELFAKVRETAGQNQLMHYLHFGDAEFWRQRNDEIDPFTVLGIFNRATTDRNRTELAGLIAAMLGVSAAPPTVFHGIAHLDPRKSIYNGNEQMWELFLRSKSRDSHFAAAYTAGADEKGNALGTLTIALFWARPTLFMPLDKISIPYIEERFGIAAPADKCGGGEYLDYLERLDAALGQRRGSDAYAAIALSAWKNVHGA